MMAQSYLIKGQMKDRKVMILRQGKGDDDKVGSAGVLPQELGLPALPVRYLCLHLQLIRRDVGSSDLG